MRNLRRGFQVFIRRNAYKYRQSKEAISLLTHDLIEIKHLVSPYQFSYFQKVKIWIEWEPSYSHATHYISSLAWLKSKGYFREKPKSTEILSVKNYLKFACLQPCMVLHEFAHACVKPNQGKLCIFEKIGALFIYLSQISHNIIR